MSAADRMTVRMRDNSIREVSRRIGLGMIARNQAKAVQVVRPAGVQAVRPQAAPEPPEPHDDEHQVTPAISVTISPEQAVQLGLRAPEPVTVTGTPDEIAAKMDALTGVAPDEQHASEGTEGVPCTCPDDSPGLEYVSNSLDADAPTVEAVPLPPEPKPSARRGVWAEYADSLGVEVTIAMTKREIQEAAQEAAESLAHLPQPAPVGGRLETPEDEPAAESAADDEDSGTR